MWYEVQRYTDAEPGDAKCAQKRFTVGPNGKIFLENYSLNRDGSLEVVMAEGTTDGHSGSFRLTFKVAGGRFTVDYNVIITDYETSAVVQFCLTTEDGDDVEFGGILSRTPDLPEDEQARLKKVLADGGSAVDELEPVVQDCGDLFDKLPGPDEV